MTETRLQKLEAMLADDPDDILCKYMVALEQDKAGNHDRSLQLLSELMHTDPPYVPAFLMAGQQQAALGDSAAAQESWSAGIQAAQLEGNEHAAAEMTQFLQELKSAN